tara:strand:- start:1067 stop:1285 length:219 start_codon:yes stop_codon:yes gene_type:complete
MKKGILDKDGYREVELTSEEISAKEARDETETAKRQAEKDSEVEKETLKASAKAKLVAGEALTQEEADTIVL